MGTELQSNRLVADRGEAECSRWLTLESLGARTMTPVQLAELSVALRALAADANELRVLQLERRHRLLEGIPNRRPSATTSNCGGGRPVPRMNSPANAHEEITSF